MTHIRIKESEVDHIIVPCEIVCDNTISLECRALLLIILTFKQESELSLRKLAKLSKKKEEYVLGLLEELRNSGYLDEVVYE